MLKKKERLSRTEFNRSFSIGKRIHCPSLQLIVDANGSFHGSAVVGKKIYKKAVDRNKIRRCLYGVLYAFYKNHTAEKTYIVIAKPAIKGMTRSAYKLELQELLQRSI